jgi:hypothetical protein
MHKEFGFMNEENVKIAKIKKSCHAGKVVSNILFIIAVIGCISGLVASIWIFQSGRKFDDMLIEARESGYASTTDKLVSAKLFNIDLADADDLESDIPALQEAIDDHPNCIMYGIYTLAMGIFTATVAVLLKLINSVFTMIEKEDTPFTDKIRKRVTLVLIVSSGLLFFTTNAGLGLLGLLMTWAVNTILDYGKTLQIQSDETL